MPRQKNDSKKAGNVIFVRLDNLWAYKHLRIAWYARLAFRYAANVDLFNPMGQHELSEAINRYNEVVKQEKGEYSINEDDDKEPGTIPRSSDFAEDFKEHIRLYGGAGETRRETYYFSQALIKAAQYGETLSDIGGGAHVILDLPTDIPILYSDVFDKIKKYLGVLQKWENNPGENSSLVYAASVIAQAAERYGDRPIILYYIRDTGMVAYELNDLIATMRRLRIYNAYIRLMDDVANKVNEKIKAENEAEKSKNKKKSRKAKKVKQVYLGYNNLKAFLSALTYAIVVYNSLRDLRPLYGAFRMLTSKALNEEGETVYGKENWQRLVNQMLGSIERAMAR